MISRTSQDIVHNVTFFFEGGRDQVTGNFDQCGLSLGPEQRNIGCGSIQPLIKEMLENHWQVLVNLWGAIPAMEFKKIFTSPKSLQMAWGNSISYGSSKYAVRDPWKSRLKQMLLCPEWIAIQDRAMETTFDRAVKYCENIKLRIVRALSLFFDICVQNGTIQSKHKEEIDRRMKIRKSSVQRNLNSREILEEVAKGRASFSRSQYQADVLSRKLCIARGKSEPFTWNGVTYSGKVHGDFLDLDKTFGLSDAPYDQVETKAEIPKPMKTPEPAHEIEEPLKEIVPALMRVIEILTAIVKKYSR